MGNGEANARTRTSAWAMAGPGKGTPKVRENGGVQGRRLVMTVRVGGHESKDEEEGEGTMSLLLSSWWW